MGTNHDFPPVNQQRQFNARMALEIENYWMERGHDPQVRLRTHVMDKNGTRPNYKVIGIQSNLVNGMPPR